MVKMRSMTISKSAYLTNKNRNCYKLIQLIEERLIFDIPLKNVDDIEIAAEELSRTLEAASWEATSEDSQTSGIQEECL